MLEQGRKIATILAADVVEYSRLMGVDEAGTLAALNERRSLFEQLVREHEGNEFGSIGDSLMAHFPSVVNALHCARAIQQAVEKKNQSLPPDRRMALRVGVNLGDVMEKDGLLYGDGVNVAARLQALATPGGIIVSAAVYQQVKNKLNAGFIPLGARPLKNITEPVLCYEVTEPISLRSHWLVAPWLGRWFVRPAIVALLLVLGGGIVWYYQNNGSAPVEAPIPATASSAVAVTANEHSIAVLPFEDMSADRNQKYMADGMAEELLNLLTQVPDLKVIARTSSFAFKGQNVDVSEIAKKLDVAHVLEGSVRTSGNRLRISAQLVRAADSTHLWSNTYDRPLGDIFAVQDDIAKAVVSELKIKLLGASPKSKGREPEAYALFLKARDIEQQHTPLAYEQSISLYRQALELDPSYAEAWDGLASNYGNQANDSIRSSDEAFRLASEAAQKALALDPRFAQARARLGSIAIYYDRDLETAASHLSHALALDPSNTEIIETAAVLLRRIGRLDQAIELGKYLVVHDPLNVDAHFDLGLAHKYAGHWDAAIAQYRSVLALSPSTIGAHGTIGEVLVLRGNPKAALAEVRLEPDVAWRLHVESLAHHALGQAAASDAALAEMIESHGIKYASFIVEEAAFRGDSNRAFEWLDKAAQSRDPSLGAIPLSQFCENLHRDPRWQRFLRKHHMAPEQLASIVFDFTLPN